MGVRLSRGTTTEYASGTDEEILRKYAVFQARRAASGGSKLPNGWGLFDMHGNVWEWCWDGYEKYDAKSPAVDSTGAAGVPVRVIRGGSWTTPPYFTRASVPERELAGDRNPTSVFAWPEAISWGKPEPVGAAIGAEPLPEQAERWAERCPQHGRVVSK